MCEIETNPWCFLEQTYCVEAYYFKCWVEVESDEAAEQD